jgi:5-methylcytosine-specific restriction protein A
VSSDQHPDCGDCGAPAVGNTPAGPLCEACAEKRQNAARATRIVWCSNRIGNCCTGRATGGFDTDEPSCEGCRRHLTRTPAKRPGGSRGAPANVRKRVLNRDAYRCQLRYEGVCIGQATQVDHIVNVATIIARGGSRQQADDMGNLGSACVPCHKQKTERERVAGLRSRNAARTKRLRLADTPHPGSW